MTPKRIYQWAKPGETKLFRASRFHRLPTSLHILALNTSLNTQHTALYSFLFQSDNHFSANGSIYTKSRCNIVGSPEYGLGPALGLNPFPVAVPQIYCFRVA